MSLSFWRFILSNLNTALYFFICTILSFCNCYFSHIGSPGPTLYFSYFFPFQFSGFLILFYFLGKFPPVFSKLNTEFLFLLIMCLISEGFCLYFFCLCSCFEDSPMFLKMLNRFLPLLKVSHALRWCRLFQGLCVLVFGFIFHGRGLFGCLVILGYPFILRAGGALKLSEALSALSGLSSWWAHLRVCDSRVITFKNVHILIARLGGNAKGTLQMRYRLRLLG